jgi:hypothetical protein
VDKSGSALHQNIARKGQNAYYHAHSRDFVIPADAKIISGPGLVTGGPPQRLVEEDSSNATILTADDKVVWLKDYSWADAGAKIKVYVPIEGLDAIVEEQVSAQFDKRSAVLSVAASPCRRLRLPKLNGTIDTDTSKVKVESAKGRVTLMLVKKDPAAWHSLLVEAK